MKKSEYQLNLKDILHSNNSGVWKFLYKVDEYWIIYMRRRWNLAVQRKLERKKLRKQNLFTRIHDVGTYASLCTKSVFVSFERENDNTHDSWCIKEYRIRTLRVYNQIFKPTSCVWKCKPASVCWYVCLCK